MAKKAQIDAVRPVLEAMEKQADKIEGFLDGLDAISDKSTDVIEAGLEKVSDVVPEALDTAVHVSTKGGRKIAGIFRDPKRAAISIMILAGLAGTGLGVAGYYLAVKRLKSKMQAEYDIQLESEIAEMRRQYVLYNKEGKFATPASAAEELLPKEVQKTIKTYRGQGGEPQNVKVDLQHFNSGESETIELSAVDQEAVLRSKGYTDQQITEVLGTGQVDLNALQEKMNSGKPIEITENTSHNIFVNGRAVEDVDGRAVEDVDGRAVEEFDYATEVVKRDPEVPYVITHDEFMENENGWSQQSLTYFNGDDTLIDDQSIPIPDIEGIVNSENLSKFGYGSRDKNMVYVRNEKIETDFEIALSMGEFSKEVGGFNELKHSAPIRRFRGEDE